MWGSGNSHVAIIPQQAYVKLPLHGNDLWFVFVEGRGRCAQACDDAYAGASTMSSALRATATSRTARRTANKPVKLRILFDSNGHQRACRGSRGSSSAPKSHSPPLSVLHPTGRQSGLFVQCTTDYMARCPTALHGSSVTHLGVQPACGCAPPAPPCSAPLGRCRIVDILKSDCL